MNASQRLVCPGLLPCDRAQMGGVKQSGQRKSPEALTWGCKSSDTYSACLYVNTVRKYSFSVKRFRKLFATAFLASLPTPLRPL